MPPSRSDAAHISFRITNPAVAALLAERAEAAGASPNLVARELLQEALTRQDALAAQIGQLQLETSMIAARLGQLDVIQRHLERSAYLLFRHAGKLDAAQAKTLMERFFAPSSLTPRDPSDALHQKNGSRE